jgi:hypothetical protein
MSDAWDGRPQNPERAGLHYITDGVALWIAHKGKWALMSRPRHEPPEWLAAQPWAEYRGPCHTPSEVAARIEAARREEREACAAAADNCWGELPRYPYEPDPSPDFAWDAACMDIAAAIRARGDA